MQCPKCQGDMDIKKIDDIEIDLCTKCGGIFLDDGEFESFTGLDPATGMVRLSRFVKVLSKLNERAVLDELTGVYTRKYYSEFIESVFTGDKKVNLTFIAIDIDHFKAVNTEHGHDGGDAVLQKVANLMKTALRTSRDDYIFRMGGEEFAILLFNLSPEDSYNVAETIRELVRLTPVKLPDGTDISITVSLGVAISNQKDNPETLYKRSDELLYKAKNSGRNKTVMEEGYLD